MLPRVLPELKKKLLTELEVKPESEPSILFIRSELKPPIIVESDEDIDEAFLITAFPVDDEVEEDAEEAELSEEAEVSLELSSESFACFCSEVSEVSDFIDEIWLFSEDSVVDEEPDVVCDALFNEEFIRLLIVDIISPFHQSL